MSDTILTGGCYCGELRYEARMAPVFQAQCHCRPCQYFSGGGPNYFMVMPAAGFSYTRGSPATFARSDIPAPRTREFCATCGTHIATLRGNGDKILKAGTLDDPTAFGVPAMAINCDEMQPFHSVADGVPCFDKMPG